MHTVLQPFHSHTAAVHNHTQRLSTDTSILITTGTEGNAPIKGKNNLIFLKSRAKKMS